MSEDDQHTRIGDLRDFRVMLIFPSGYYELFRRAHPCLFAGAKAVEGEPVTGIFQNKNSSGSGGGRKDCLLYTSAQLNEGLHSSDEYNPVGTALYPYMVSGTIAVSGPVLLEAQGDYHFEEPTIRHVLRMRTPAWHTQLTNNLIIFSPLIFMVATFGAIFVLGRLSVRSVAGS